MGTYLADIWRCRYFWLSLVKMDLRTRYRRSVLGLGWSLLHPIAMTTILCIVFHRIFHVDLRDYAPRVLSGLTFWNYLVSVTILGCQCFFHGEAYIRQHPSPLAIFPLRTALGGIVHFLPALAVVLLVTCFTLGPPSVLALLSLVPTLVLIFALGWSLALLAGLANVVFQDTQHLLEVAFQLLFYATPILYPVSVLETNKLGWLLRLNPLVAFVELVREPILAGRVPSLVSYATAATVVLVVGSAAALLLKRLQRQLIFYL